ncbi:MAG: glycosyltransferase [Pyrinomonadaceae bacterium]
MNDRPRVAFFADSYLEVNGAAMTCRRLVDFAQRKGFYLLCVHAGPQTDLSQNGSIADLSLGRSPISISLDDELAYDPLFQRHASRVRREIEKFRPDIIHITGVNDVSIIGAYLAWKCKIPLIGSWHTNLHEFAARRIKKILRFLPTRLTDRIAAFAENAILSGATLYYQMPQINLAPNRELVDLLERRTRRPGRLMARGVDLEKFSPDHRDLDDGVLRFGYAGRLRPEKNVRSLVDIERALIAAGKSDFKFLIVGDGSERNFLEKNLSQAEFTGMISGSELSTAYANMDVFIFPSETETFGNVTLEANASGVPAIVSDKGASKFLIVQGENGFVATNADEFANFVIQLVEDRPMLDRMKKAARKSALGRSWDAVFESVYDAYDECIGLVGDKRAEDNPGINGERPPA